MEKVNIRMLDSKDTDKIKKEFISIQQFLLMHKYYYYIEDTSFINDIYYDSIEKYSMLLAIKLGFNTDNWKNLKGEEKHHVHWMVGFDKNNPFWKSTKERYSFLKQTKL